MRKILLAMAVAASTLGAWAAPITAPVAGQDYFLLNAANNEVFLTFNNTNVRLSVANEAKYQRVQFVAVDTLGKYNIRMANGEYLATDGKWSTIFLADGTDENAQVTLEAGTGDAVKVKFVSTGKYLGSDKAADDEGIFTDKSGAEAKFQWVVSEAPVIAKPNAEKMYRLYNVKSGEYIKADGSYTRAPYAKNNNQIFVLAAVDGKDATYTIKDDADSYLGSDNEWNSKALSDATDAYAQWNVTVDGDHLFFKNLGTKKDANKPSFLGCDGDNAGVWTDKNSADNEYTRFRLVEAIKGEPEIVFNPDAKNLLLNGNFQAEGWTPGSDVTNIPDWAAYVSDNTENRDWIGTVTMLVDSATSNVALDMAINAGCTWWGGYIGVEQEVDVTVGTDYVLAFDYMFDNAKQASWHARVVGTEILLDKNGNAVKTEMTQSLSKFTADTTKVKVQFYIVNDFNQAAGVNRNFIVDNVVLYDPNAPVVTPDTVTVNALSELKNLAVGTPFKMGPTLLITHTFSAVDEDTNKTMYSAFVYDDKTFGVITSDKAIGDNQKNIVDGWFGTVGEDYVMTPTSELTIVDGHLELPAPTKIEDADFSAAYCYQYVQLPAVTFAEATPADATDFVGTVGTKEVDFLNAFKVASQAAGDYSVTGYVILDAEDTIVFPVAYGEAEVGIAGIEAEDAPAVYYNLQGVKIDAPAAGAIVIKVQGNEATKIVVR